MADSRKILFQKPKSVFSYLREMKQQKIEACIHSILSQDYPSELFSLIIIDDHSTDQNAPIGSHHSKRKSCFGNDSLERIFERIKMILRFKKNGDPKRYFQKATGDLIISTDADCIAPENWLSSFGLIL